MFSKPSVVRIERLDEEGMKYAFGTVTEPGDDIEPAEEATGDFLPTAGDTVFVCSTALGRVRTLAKGRATCVFHLRLKPNRPENRDKTPWIVDGESMVLGLYGQQPASEPQDTNDQEWEDVVAEGEAIQDLLDEIVIESAEPTEQARAAIRAEVAAEVDFIREPAKARAECVCRLAEHRAELKRERAQQVIAVLTELKESLSGGEPASGGDEDPEEGGLALVDTGEGGTSAAASA